MMKRIIRVRNDKVWKIAFRALRLDSRILWAFCLPHRAIKVDKKSTFFSLTAFFFDPFVLPYFISGVSSLSTSSSSSLSKFSRPIASSYPSPSSSSSLLESKPFIANLAIGLVPSSKSSSGTPGVSPSPLRNRSCSSESCTFLA